MPKKSTKLEAVHDIFTENGITSKDIERNAALIRAIDFCYKKYRCCSGLQTSPLRQAFAWRCHNDYVFCVIRKCK